MLTKTASPVVTYPSPRVPQFGSQGKGDGPDISALLKMFSSLEPGRPECVLRIVRDYELTSFRSLTAAQSRFATHPDLQESYKSLTSSPMSDDPLSNLVNRATLGLLVGANGEKDFKVFRAYRDAVNLMLSEIRTEAERGRLVNMLSEKEAQHLEFLASQYERDLQNAIELVGTEQANLRLAALANTMIKAHKSNRESLEIQAGQARLPILSEPRKFQAKA